MKKQQDPKDPTKDLLSSVGITKNEQTNNYEMSAAPPEIPGCTEEVNEVISGLEKPSYYPSIVLRLVEGVYCYFPIHISTHMGTMEEYKSLIMGKYREIVVRPEMIVDENFMIDVLMRITRQESVYHLCQSCLCLGPERAIYYRPNSDEFDNQTAVPECNNWLSAQAYESLVVHDIDDEQKRHLRKMNKSLTRQYFFLDEN